MYRQDQLNFSIVEGNGDMAAIFIYYVSGNLMILMGVDEAFVYC